MTLPIRFPNQADAIYQEALAYRRLSPTERLLALLDLIASGAALLEHSPHRAESARLHEAQEAQWQAIQKELFARHAR
jgi:hypothetical protein